MFVLENGDKIQGDASAATVVDYHISGLTGSTLKNLADGQLAATIGDLYTSAATDLAKTIVLTNTDSVERTINLYHTPSGGTARRILPKNMAIQAGGTILFDGENVSVLSAIGGLVSTVAISDGSVALAKIVDIATASFLGRDTAGTGVTEVLSATEARAVLNVEDGATADQTDAEIRAAVAAATDSNVYDDAAVTKLGGIEALADVTDATNVAAAGALLTSGGTMSGTLSLADNIVSRPVLEDYAIQGSAVGAVGATRTFDCAVANYFTATLDQACTFTFSNPPATGDAGGFRLVLTNGGAYAITFPAAVDWDGGTAPTLTAAGVDIMDFTTSDAGTIWYGTVVGLDMK
tara:strand:- start:1121 stop:2170 length:1050 start_codon:yes stop_codon:yes gene_type:complete